MRITRDPNDAAFAVDMDDWQVYLNGSLAAIETICWADSDQGMLGFFDYEHDASSQLRVRVENGQPVINKFRANIEIRQPPAGAQECSPCRQKRLARGNWWA